MPKGMHKMDVRGAECHWFECTCGYRWEGATQRAKTLAHRLHSKHCNTGQLNNRVVGHCHSLQSETSFIDQKLATMKVADEVAPAPVPVPAEEEVH